MEAKNNIIKGTSVYEDEIFNIPFDKVPLPSEGKLYGGEIPGILEVEYMTTKDENILYSSELMSNGAIFNTLVKEKLKDKDIRVEDLLIGDFNEILLFLRKSAYGDVYTTTTIDPDSGEPTKMIVDLNKFTRKPLSAEFDEKGEFEFVLPIMNKRITFKMMTVGMGDYINARAEKLKNKRTNTIPYITVRLETIIMSIEDKREKAYISKFVEIMNPRDRLALMEYIEQIQPGVDLQYTFKSTIRETDFTDTIVLGLDFFYPTSKK